MAYSATKGRSNDAKTDAFLLGSSLMTGEPIIVRPAGVEDAAALIEFLRVFQSEAHTGVLAPTRALPTQEQEVSWIRSFLEYESSHLLVACKGEDVVGILEFRGHRHPQMKHGGTLGTSLLPAVRGLGVGFQLMKTLFTWATVHPTLHRIELEVFSSNTQAIAFYERQGFVREGARQNAVVIEGKYQDIVLMARQV